ncbi:hypothetical protein [Bosea sp. (in: a-proteobacteria)]|uniref:hypothetical protein n=1 Tax=Bosea sp. (in: a-proteobacteria) TaxID=1871050 RepID=UPI002734128D|nr:hypothetical protein [Bosea sp. (in: a-proteobacteria)]MDP3408076.1 hypothetical protein [Bosea sp. (in: a-proteobacteria)]
MASRLAAMYARTAAASSLAEEAWLETRAHGSIRTRGHFIRAEVERRRIDDDVRILDAEPWAVIPLRDAPDLDREGGDVIWIDDRLWTVEKALENGAGQLKLMLQEPQFSKAAVGGIPLRVAFAGHKESLEEAAVAIVPTGVALAPGQTIEVENGGDWTVATVAAWKPGYRRVALTAA